MADSRCLQLSIHALAGGQGATTIAGSLARLWNVPLTGVDRWEDELVFGPRATADCSSWCEVRDAGSAPLATTEGGTTVAVLRGPSTVMIQRLSAMPRRPNYTFLVHEAWRTFDRRRFEAATGTHIDAQITFSEKVSRMADAGLLGMRLAKLDEFAELRDWASMIERRFAHDLGF